MDFYKYAEMIDANGGVATPEIIAQAIADHSELHTRTQNRYGRYKQERGKDKTPILDREFEGVAAKKINNKIANDYFGEIIDTKVGYIFGIPVSIKYDKEAVGHDDIAKKIKRFVKVNNLDDLNGEIGKFAAMCGYDAALCYIDKEGQERVIRVDPWESIVISKTALTEPEYGIIYYKTWDEKYRVEFYDSTNKTIFESETGYDKLVQIEQKAHMFKYCPLFGIPNNAELQGDADKVLTLIDGYDRTFSNMVDEVEQFRLAYLLYIGYEPDEKIIADMVKTGALYIPDSGNGEDIKWLTKELDPTYVNATLDRAEANITRFAKHVNFTDAAFGKDITGPAMRYKLFSLETKSKYFERKHEAAMLYMFKVVGSAWKVKSVPFDYMNVDLVYTRNIPANLLDEAQTASALMAVTSHRTALRALSIVNDADEELAQREAEIAEKIDLDKINADKDKDKDKDDDTKDDREKGRDILDIDK